MKQTSDGRMSGGAGCEPLRKTIAEAATHGAPLANVDPRALRTRPEASSPFPTLDAPRGGGGDGLVERETAAILASLESLRRCAHFGRRRPELVGRLSEALSRVDDALAEAVRELYGRAGDSEEA